MGVFDGHRDIRLKKDPLGYRAMPHGHVFTNTGFHWQSGHVARPLASDTESVKTRTYGPLSPLIST